MKILVLGQRGTSGDRNEGVSWTTIMRDRLAAELEMPSGTLSVRA